ncbi:MAG: hypothetical protein CVU71_14085 [Deltaproteobacteria bacterium HGW-Deltaproteobacteria-6]|jgi:membrane-bound lytic murein transglycosylase B|nr:MAG: hypothetical protein CVU71_14085 [Deltaproteobacteria bacterium HGW-Deltaproteobacteria-6]
MKIVSIAIAALFIATCFFNHMAIAESKAAGERELTGKEITKDKTGKRAEGKKKRRGKKQKPVITDSIEKREATLKASFLRAGISQADIDEIFSDERIELYHNIYPPPVANGGGTKKKKLSYFDEEFGLLKPESIESGKKLIAANKELFEKIESLYGVPASYIVSIIRIETAFKEHLGKYGVFNSLYTMSMLSKRAKRVQMANRELVVWVKMCKRKGMDPFAMKGSWAGAFGIPQFMPSSYIIFAVDNNGDGIIDLHDYPDAFASIANYLHRVGWKTGNERKMRRAVYSYNHEKAYVNAVFAYAESI